jgi:opacity protein-like surface antigen
MAAATLTLSAPARADGQRGYKDGPAPAYYRWYVEGRLGGSIDDTREADMVSPNVAGANGPIEIEIGDGFGFAVSVGRYFNERWRAEVAWSHGTADEIDVDYSKAPATFFFPQKLRADGDITVNSVMFNVLRSWRRTFFGRFRPFNGAGIGFTHIDIDMLAPPTSRFVVDGSDTVFTAAYHSGVDWEMSDRTALTLRVTTMVTTGSSFGAIDTLNAGGIMTMDGDTEISTAITGGLRIKLN